MLPRDSEGYVIAFNHNNTDDIISFLNKYGVVVVKNVLNRDEIASSIKAILLQEEFTSRGVKWSDKTTWDRCWPMDGKIEKKGWISNSPTLFCRAAWYNRLHPNLLGTFKALWKDKGTEEEQLRVNTDRYGVMRPIIKKEWQTDKSWLHTDQNPASEHDFVRFQGILTFTNSNKYGGGGFICVPGFHNEWTDYCKTNPIDKDVCSIPDDLVESLQKRAEKIYARAGSLIIWDSRLPHANFPNISKEKFRFVQYITYYPASHDSSKKKRILNQDALAVVQYMEETHGITFTEEQLKLIGFATHEKMNKLFSNLI